MSWAVNKLALGGIALIAIVTAGTAAANVLVVRSVGPSASAYPAGRSLPDNVQIALRSGDTLTILGARGTRTFRGPGTFNPSADVRSGPGRSGENSRARTGGVRGGPAMAGNRPATVWDTSQSGTVCVADPVGVRLWRSNWGSSETLAINVPGGRPQTLRWRANSSVLDWPASLPATDGAEYELRRSRASGVARIRLKRLDSRPQDAQSLAEALIRNACTTQLDLMIDTHPRL